jgi:GNAT superfamily N-acetyltransferase
VTLPPDLRLRPAEQGDVPGMAALVAACDESYREWAPEGWTPPPPGRELDRWRGRITDGSWWTRVAVEAGGRIVGLVCFTQAVTQRSLGDSPLGRAGPAIEPIPRRAHVSAVFSHPDRWREGIASGMLEHAEDAMRAAGYREVQLWTPREAPARRFYEATGWRHDGREQWLADVALPIVAYVKAL